ncbi:MAG: lysylphosphatidylglycerol synthase domain-containing protein [Arachnia sp.]
MALVSIALLWVAAWLVGSQALLAGWAALTPLSILAALLLGLSTTAAQSVRWYISARHHGIDVGFRRALVDCYASSFGNMVLPGGLGGDVARVAVYRDGGSKRWASPLIALGAERLTATTILFVVAAQSLVAMSVSLASVGAGVALIALIASAWCMRGLGLRRSLLLWCSSAMGVASLIALYLVAMASLGGPILPGLAVVGLASMSVPIGVGGWGVRELSVVVLAPVLAVGDDYAAATSIAYGLLATISCLPGLGVLLSMWWRRGKKHRV